MITVLPKKFSQLYSGLGIKYYIYPNAIRHRTEWIHGYTDFSHFLFISIRDPFLYTQWLFFNFQFQTKYSLL